MRIAIIAGEASGDLLGSGLLSALRERYGALEIEGIGGPQMQAQGCVSLYPMERLSIIGLFEAFGRLPELLPVRARLSRRFLANPPDIFVGVDAPDFNLALARRLREAGIATAHYVSPSVWAWRRYRIRKIARSIDLMMVLFPFEAAFYREHDLPVEFVGHPLADQIPDNVDTSAAREALGIPTGGQVVALLPGSRMSELKFLSATMIETAVWLKTRHPDLRFVTPLVDRQIRAYFRSALDVARVDLDIELFDGRSRDVMAASDVVLTASGTASLEAMLLKRPMVVIYRTTALSYAILKRWVGANIPHVALPNLLAGKELVPELLQDAAVPEKIGPRLLEFLEQPNAEMQDTFVALHRELKKNASQRAADAITGLID